MSIIDIRASFTPSIPSLQHASEGFGLLARPPSFSVQHPSFSLLFSANATQLRHDVEDAKRPLKTPTCFPAMATSLSHLEGLPETSYRPLRLQKERQRAGAKSQRIGEVAMVCKSSMNAVPIALAVLSDWAGGL